MNNKVNQWRLEIDYPSGSINKRLKFAHGKAIYTKSGEAHMENLRRFKTSVWANFKNSKLPSFGKSMIKMNIELFMPDKRRRDLDGVIKVVLDALQDAGAYDDDYQIYKLTVERMDEVIENGKCVITIEDV